MEQSISEIIPAMEKMVQENNELARKSRKITIIGSIMIVFLFVFFGTVLYGQYTNFNITQLQNEVAERAPGLLQPEVNMLRQDISAILYPKLVESVSAKTAEQLPRVQTELEKQMVILIGDLENSFKKKFTGETSKALHDSMGTGFENFDLTAEQQKIVDAFVEDSVAYVLADMQPYMELQAARSIDKLNQLFESMYRLEETRLGQYIWPKNPEDATVELFKAILGLTIIKLDRQDVRAALHADVQADINKIAD